MQGNLTSLQEKIKGCYIICSCEGKAEKAIIEILLDAGVLCFTKEDLVDDEVTLTRQANQITERYLNREYARQVVILRIVDRSEKKEQFHLTQLYKNRYPVFTILTQPEIEVLHIIHEGLWDEYLKEKNKNKVKPSDFFKKHHPREAVKAEKFVKKYYANPQALIEAIRVYHHYNHKNNVYDLNDLLVE